MGSRRGWSLMRTLQPDPIAPPKRSRPRTQELSTRRICTLNVHSVHADRAVYAVAGLPVTRGHSAAQYPLFQCRSGESSPAPNVTCTEEKIILHCSRFYWKGGVGGRGGGGGLDKAPAGYSSHSLSHVRWAFTDLPLASARSGMITRSWAL